jgi:DNA-directed RNA polymerase specialized sigma24 family protein
MRTLWTSVLNWLKRNRNIQRDPDAHCRSRGSRNLIKGVGVDPWPLSSGVPSWGLDWLDRDRTMAGGVPLLGIIGWEYHQVEEEQLLSVVWETYQPQIQRIAKTFCLKWKYKYPSLSYDDLLQEAFFSVKKSLASYKLQKPLLPWLSTVLRHHYSDLLRKEMRQQKHLLPFDVDIAHAMSFQYRTGSRGDFKRFFNTVLTEYQRKLLMLVIEPPEELLWVAALHAGKVKNDYVIKKKDIADFLGCSKFAILSEFREMRVAWERYCQH